MTELPRQERCTPMHMQHTTRESLLGMHFCDRAAEESGPAFPSLLVNLSVVVPPVVRDYLLSARQDLVSHLNRALGYEALNRLLHL